MRKQRVVPLDRHDGLPRVDVIAVVQGVHRQRVPVPGAELQNRDRLVHPAEVCVLLLEYLHDDPGTPVVVQQRRARMVEISVGVVAVAHLLDRQIEDVGREALARLLPERHRGYSRSSARQAARAASATSSCSGVGSAVARRCWSSWPGLASALASFLSGLRTIQPKISVEAASATSCAPRRAGVRSSTGAREARMLPITVVASSGPTRCEPQRSCSFVAPSPCSYVPIEMCSAPL